MTPPTLLMIVGPTAVGKTDVAIRLAELFGTEIVSADARQCYRGMPIGTAQPTAAERQRVKHHLVDFLPVTQSYDVGRFEQDALRAVGAIHRQHPFAIAVGGSGLYLKTLSDGIDAMPKVVPALREELNRRWQQEGRATLVDELRRVDPDYHAQADLNNPRRVIRALEVYRSTGVPYSSFRTGQPAATRPFCSLRIGLDLPRERLYERIDARVDRMIEQGLVEEVRTLSPRRDSPALRTVGYQEIFPVFDGTYDLREAVRRVKRNSRRYAKRQLTWFRKDARIRWFDAREGTDALVARISSYVEENVK